MKNRYTDVIMDLSKSLTELGLSEAEAAIYLSCLQLGAASVLHISENAGVKRPTTYLILDNLEQRGLIKKTKQGTKTHFQAEPPHKILEELHTKKVLAEQLLPSLQAIHNIDPEKPNITIAEGMEGVRRTYQHIFLFLRSHPKEELLIFGALKDAVEHFEKEVLDSFYWNLAQSKNPIREIGNDDVETRRYFRRSVQKNPNHQIRLIRDDGRFFQTDNMLYGNTLTIFSVKKQIFATQLSASNITETYRTLFEMAWRSAKTI